MRKFWLVAFVLGVAGCTPGEQVESSADTADGPPRVFTVNYPLAYFAERIAGHSVDVVFPAPIDIDPAMWSPSVETVADYQWANLVLLNGAGYAGWTQRVTLPQSRLRDTSAGFSDQLIPIETDVTHSHGPAGDHSHQGTAFTTWLDMQLAIGHARAVFEALLSLRPEHEAEYRDGWAQLEGDLMALDDGLHAVAARVGEQPLLFSHPVYQYLVRGYSLNGRAVHWEPGERPTEEQWRQLSDVLKMHAAAWMIWEGDPHPDAVSKLEELGIRSLVFRPVGNRPANGDFMSVMRDNLRVLQEAFPDKPD